VTAEAVRIHAVESHIVNQGHQIVIDLKKASSYLLGR
jgi:hypothetical protein